MTTAGASDSPEVPSTWNEMDVHRALGSPVRSHLFQVLRDAGQPLRISRLAEAVDLHPNTVRSHLAVLVQARLVVGVREAPDGPGRPPLAYRSVVEDPASADDGYRVLASLLAEQVSADHPDVARVSQDAATAWGRRLIAWDDQDQVFSDAQVVQRLMEMLEQLGFTPSLDGEIGHDARLRFDRCPFRDVADSHPELACAVHRGLVQGALDAMDSDLLMSGLGQGRRGGSCVAHLRSPT